jgi:hypothetical protein
VAIGWVGRGGLALLAAVVAFNVPWAIGRAWWSGETVPEGVTLCEDPGCPDDVTVSAILVLFPLVLASLGWGTAALAARIRRPS